jgi:hypothetical protein
MSMNMNVALEQSTLQQPGSMGCEGGLWKHNHQPAGMLCGALVQCVLASHLRGQLAGLYICVIYCVWCPVWHLLVLRRTL